MVVGATVVGVTPLAPDGPVEPVVPVAPVEPVCPVAAALVRAAIGVVSIVRAGGPAAFPFVVVGALVVPVTLPGLLVVVPPFAVVVVPPLPVVVVVSEAAAENGKISGLPAESYVTGRKRSSAV